MEQAVALNFSLNMSRDAGGVHRRKAILVFLPPIPKKDSWRALQQTENDAIFTLLSKPHTHLLVAMPSVVPVRLAAGFFRSPGAGFSTAFLPNFGL